MDIADAQELIERGVQGDRPARWADLGCGHGTFTYALSGLLASGSDIWAVDLEPRRLKSPITDVTILFQQGDIEIIDLPNAFEGILMANSLHYIADKEKVLVRLLDGLLQGGRLLIVEYDTMRSNPWIPFPISFVELTRLSQGLGLEAPEKLSQRPSQFGGWMYCAAIRN
ncbi:MAG: methyltransferase domain-containing protein [Bacteroidota bacterium]